MRDLLSPTRTNVVRQTPPLWGSLDGADQQLRGSLRANETLQGFPFASQSGLWGFKNLHSAFSSNILRLGIYMWMLYVHSIMIMLPCFLYLLLFRSFESGVFDSMRHVFFAQPIFICLTSIGKKKQNHLGFKGGGGNFLMVINHWALKKNQLDEAKSSTIPRAWSLETGTKHAILASCALRLKKSFKMFLSE